MYLMGSLSSIHMEENWIEKPIIIATLNFLKLTRKNTFSDSCKKLSKKSVLCYKTSCRESERNISGFNPI